MNIVSISSTLKTHRAVVPVLLTGFIINICLGAVYSWSVYRVPVEAALDLTSIESAVPYTLFLAVFAFSMPLGGWLINRIGFRKTMLLGAALVSAGWFVSGFSQDNIVLSLGYGVLGGLGVGLGYGVPLNSARRVSHERPGLAMGIVLLGFGVSPFLTAPVAEFLIRHYGVHASFRIMGLSFAALLIPLSFVFADSNKDLSAGRTENSQWARRLFTHPAFYTLWAAFGLAAIAGLTSIGMTAQTGITVFGLETQTAAKSVSAFALLNGMGRPLFGALSDRIGAARAGAVASGVAGIGAILLIMNPLIGMAAYAVGFACLWLSLGGWLAVAPNASAHVLGSADTALKYGVVFSAYGMGALCGPLVTSAAYKLGDGPEDIFMILAGAAMISVILSLRLSRHDASRSFGGGI